MSPYEIRSSISITIYPTSSPHTHSPHTSYGMWHRRALISTPPLQTVTNRYNSFVLSSIPPTYPPFSVVSPIIMVVTRGVLLQKWSTISCRRSGLFAQNEKFKGRTLLYYVPNGTEPNSRSTKIDFGHEPRPPETCCFPGGRLIRFENTHTGYVYFRARLVSFGRLQCKVLFLSLLSNFN